ncbi:MAG: class I SAM-dependent methyltransferase [Elusimicrobia bacterium]|nr:class I SAM-dependent methyltransferase [Elusimicrobiota bacterium]
MDSKLEHEIEHGALIKHRAEEIWGWASAAGQARAERRGRFFVERCRLGPKDRALEVGCGSGVFTEKVARSGAQITATDLSEDLLQLARGKNIPNAKIETADAHKLAYPSGSFDVVYGSSILHHLDVRRALEEFFRVLKPGGRLAFAEPNMMNPQIAVMKNVGFVKRRMGESPDETAFFRWRLAADLRSAGFSAVEVVPYDFLHPAVPAGLIDALSRLTRILERVPLLREIAGSLLIYAEKR